VDASELEDFGQDATNAERRSLGSSSKDLAEQIDDIVLSDGNCNKEIR
jgi:hypothetical protein